MGGSIIGVIHPSVTDYLLCSWRVRSAISLPELTTWCSDNRLPDVEIVFATVPRCLEDGMSVVRTSDGAVSLEVGADGSGLLHVATVGRFLVSGGRHVAVKPQHPVDEPAFAYTSSAPFWPC